MPYILKEENIEEFLRKSEMDEFEEKDFGEFYPDDYKMVDKSGMFEDFRFKLVVLESLLGKNASFVDEFKEFTKKLEEKYDDYVFEIGNFINPVIIEPILKFLENVELTEEDLEKVDEICIGGGLEIYGILCPNWDGEDELFEIKSVKGFEKLKNLKKVIFISCCDEELLDEFRESGIEVE